MTSAEELVHLAQFLGPRALEVVQNIPDPGFRQRVVSAVEICAATLRVVDGVDLSPHELADLETPNVSAWSALAPEVRNVLVAMRSAIDRLEKLFPPEIELSGADPEFASMIGDLVDRDQHAQQVDEIVRGSGSGQSAGVSESVHMLALMLEKEIRGLGGKLRLPQVVGDRWFLLGELHQFLGQCGQCLEAIVASVLSACTSENLDDILPRYLDSTTRSLKLRSAIVDLGFDVDQYGEAIKQAEGVELSILFEGLVDRMNAFSNSSTHRFLKPQDKRPIILFRIFLSGGEKVVADPAKLRLEVEGFSKFLVLMRDLNWSEALKDQDRRAVDAAKSALDSGIEEAMLLLLLAPLYGRTAALDVVIRDMRSGRPAPQQALKRLILETEARLRAL